MRCRRLLCISAYNRLFPNSGTSSGINRPTWPSFFQMPQARDVISFIASAGSGSHNSAWSSLKLMCAPFFLTTTAAVVLCEAPRAPIHSESTAPESVELVNWSGTHCVSTNSYFQPESLEELKSIVQEAHTEGRKLRPIGSALSPNGLGFQEEGMINLALMDAVLHVDKEKMQVTVQAGARVSQVVDALRPHGLTLANFASITEQQIGGFIQVGAHGTGAGIPTVDEQVVALKLITPAAGEVDLSIRDDDPSLFRLARTSLGVLGVVAEVTLQCVPMHRLVEKTFVVSREDVWRNHKIWLAENRHLRYMWIPHTNDVVVVMSNVFEGDDKTLHQLEEECVKSREDLAKLRPAQQLLLSHPDCAVEEETILKLSFTELRSELLRLDALNCDWVRKVNETEAHFWKKSQGTHVDWSDRILQFDCGGQQWVSEVAFPVLPNNDEPADLKYVEDILRMVEEESIPAHAPIEQRWSAPSSSPLSAASEKPSRELAPLYSWVGVIMYLPDATETEDCIQSRSRITSAFRAYKRGCEKFWRQMHAVEHWAKIEMPHTEEERVALQLRMADKYPLDALNAVRTLFDPRRILESNLMSVILGGAPMIKGNMLNPGEGNEKGG